MVHVATGGYGPRLTVVSLLDLGFRGGAGASCPLRRGARPPGGEEDRVAATGPCRMAHSWWGFLTGHFPALRPRRWGKGYGGVPKKKPLFIRFLFSHYLSSHKIHFTTKAAVFFTSTMFFHQTKRILKNKML